MKEQIITGCNRTQYRSPGVEGVNLTNTSNTYRCTSAWRSLKPSAQDSGEDRGTLNIGEGQLPPSHQQHTRKSSGVDGHHEETSSASMYLIYITHSNLIYNNSLRKILVL